MSTSTSPTSDKNNYLRLSIMMFLQFFVWGSWFVTLYMVLSSNNLGDIIPRSYSTAPIAAIIAPLFLGLVADRFFSSEKVMSALLVLGGVLLLFVPSAIANQNGSLVVWLFTGHMLCYMPTLALGNTIAFTSLPREIFPKIRVWGTIGWIAAGLVAGFLGWSSSSNLFLDGRGMLDYSWFFLFGSASYSATSSRQAIGYAGNFHDGRV